MREAELGRLTGMQNNVTEGPLHPKSLLRSSVRELFLPGINAEYTGQVRVTLSFLSWATNAGW